MEDPTSILITHGNISKRCILDSGRPKDAWGASEMDDKFAVFFAFIKSNKLKSSYGIDGNMRKEHKSIFLLIAHYFLSELCEKHSTLKNTVFVNGSLDYAKLFAGPWNLLTDVLLVFFKDITVVKEQFLVVVSNVINDNYNEAKTSLSQFREISRKLFSENNEDAVLINMHIGDIEIGLGADNNREQVLPREPIPPLEPVPYQLPPPPPPVNQDSFEIIFPLLQNEIKTYYRPPYEFVKDSTLNNEQRKCLLFQALLLPYVRLSTLDNPIFDPLNPSFTTFEVFENTFDVRKWIGHQMNGTYQEKVVEKKREIAHIIKTEDFTKMREIIYNLNQKCGFRYGVKLLSFANSQNLQRRLNQKENGSLMYKINDLRQVYADILDIDLKSNEIKALNKTDLISAIIRNNPHTILNSVTFYTDELLMDMHPLLLHKIENLNTAFDITELVPLILSSEGRNEHMGLPDMPEKGKIWSNGQDILDILIKVDTFVRSDNPILKQAQDDLVNACKAIIRVDEDEIKATLSSIRSLDFLKDATIHFARINEFDYFLSLCKKSAESFEDKLHPIYALIYVLHKQYLHKIVEYKELLKDINLLHLVGYLGWIMLSDNVTSHSQDANDFEVTNECKDLFETYILRLGEREDARNDQCFYYKDNYEYPTSYNKKHIVEKLMTLQFNGQKLGTVINSATCLHGIGGNLVAIYLKTIHELSLVVESKLFKDIPFYVDPKSIKPLAIFKHIGNGEYIYTVKNIGNITKNADPLSSEDYKFQYFNNTNDSADHHYTIQTCKIATGERGWRGHVYITKGDINTLTKENKIKYSIYQTNMANLKLHYDAQYLRLFFQKPESRELLYASDLFMQHRIEHFRIFTRYVVDFSNMICEYYKEGIITSDGKLHLDDSNKPYIYAEYPDSKYDDKEDLKNYLYGYHFNYMYSDEDEIKKDFENKFKYHMNVNSVVGRDYDADLNKKSELVYFHDLIGRSSEIYEREIRSGEKNLFGIINKHQGKLLGDLFMDKLGKDVTFNKMIITKAMISKVLLKILQPNFVNPFYMNANDDSDNIDSSTMFNIQMAAVQQSLNYINLSSFDAARNDSIETLRLRVLKGYVKYGFFVSIIEILIAHTIPQIGDMMNFKQLLSRTFFKPIEEVTRQCDINNLVKNTYINNVDTDKLKEINKYLKKEIVEGLFKFFSLFFNPYDNVSFNYHIANMMALRPLLDDIGKIIDSPEGGIAKLAAIIKPTDADDDEKHICSLYTDGIAEIFPGKDKALFHKGKFLSEMVETYFKYDLMKTISMPIQQLTEIFNAIDGVSSFEYRGDIVDASNSISSLLKSGIFYQDLIANPLVMNLIGANKTNQNDRILSLMSSIIHSMCDMTLPRHMYRLQLSVYCITAFENIHIYKQDSVE